MNFRMKEIVARKTKITELIDSWNLRKSDIKFNFIVEKGNKETIEKQVDYCNKQIEKYEKELEELKY